MSRDEFFNGLESRPAGVSPLRWVADLGGERPPEASIWLMEWLRPPSSTGEREGRE